MSGCEDYFVPLQVGTEADTPRALVVLNFGATERQTGERRWRESVETSESVVSLLSLNR